MSKQERIIGSCYLAFQQFVLPWLLSSVFGLLPFAVSNVWLNLCYFVINFCAVLWIFRRFLKRSMNAVPKHFWRFLGVSVAGFVLYWFSNMALTALIGLFFPGFANINDTTVAALAGSNIYIMAIGTVILVPVVEEVLFRGVIFGAFSARKKIAAYALSTLIFAFIHVMGYIGSFPPVTLILCFLQYIPAGLCLAWAYEASGSIFSPSLIHTVVNALGILSLR